MNSQYKEISFYTDSNVEHLIHRCSLIYKLDKADVIYLAIAFYADIAAMVLTRYPLGLESMKGNKIISYPDTYLFPSEENKLLFKAPVDIIEELNAFKKIYKMEYSETIATAMAFLFQISKDRKNPPFFRAKGGLAVVTPPEIVRN